MRLILLQLIKNDQAYAKNNTKNLSLNILMQILLNQISDIVPDLSIQTAKNLY